MLLRVISKAKPVSGRYFSGVWSLDPAEQAEQSGLSRAVQAEHHYPAATVNGDIHIGEYFEGPVGLGQALRGERGPAAGFRRREAELGHLVGLALRLDAGQHALGPALHVLGGLRLRR